LFNCFQACLKVACSGGAEQSRDQKIQKYQTKKEKGLRGEENGMEKGMDKEKEHTKGCTRSKTHSLDQLK